MSYIVGLTGGIGCGKSTIAELFAELGVPIVDADIVARQVVKKGSPLLEKITQHFGTSVLLPTGELNRALLRQKVFQNPTEKQWLNSLLHPAIRAEMQQQLQQYDAPYVLWVVPLLFENKLTHFCDRILVIDVSEETQIKRASLRDNNSVDLIHQIMRAQVSRQQRLAKADDVINNELPFAENEQNLRQQVAKLHLRYLKLSQS